MKKSSASSFLEKDANLKENDPGWLYHAMITVLETKTVLEPAHDVVSDFWETVSEP